MKTIHERIDRIRAAIEATNNIQDRHTHTISNWRGQRQAFPIIRIESEYLMYRIENSRTRRQQITYLEDHPELDKNFFSDPEEPKVQRAQDEILNELLQSTGDFIQDLRDHGQDEPAIITYEGYLVNGNRRTTALRTLGVEHIDCIVLPKDTTKKEIYSLEQELQISQDFKEEYHWVNELINMYEGITNPDLNFTKKQMARRLRIRTNTLEAKLRMFDLVDLYLDWKGMPTNYGYKKLDLAEEAFRQLEKGSRNKQENRKTEELRNAIFTLIEEPPTKVRLYTHVTQTINNWNAIYGKICEQKGYVKPDDSDDSERDETIDPNDLLERIANQIPEENAPKVFSDHGHSEENAGLLLEIKDDIVALSKEVSKAEEVYDAVSSALRELLSLSVSEDSTRLEATKNKLEEIVKVSNKLMDQISRISK